MTVSKNLARFILAAVSKDSTRENLTAPCVVDMHGARWLCSTDGHRLHAVWVPVETPLGWCALGKGGMAFYGVTREGTFPPLEQVWFPKLDERAVLVEVSRLAAISASRHDDMRITFGLDDAEMREPYARYVEDDFEESEVHLSAAYTNDVLLAVPSGKNAPALVRVARSSDTLDPVMFCEDADVPAWRAIVMPIRK